MPLTREPGEASAHTISSKQGCIAVTHGWNCQKIIASHTFSTRKSSTGKLNALASDGVFRWLCPDVTTVYMEQFDSSGPWSMPLLQSALQMTLLADVATSCSCVCILGKSAPFGVQGPWVTAIIHVACLGWGCHLAPIIIILPMKGLASGKAGNGTFVLLHSCVLCQATALQYVCFWSHLIVFFQNLMRKAKKCISERKTKLFFFVLDRNCNEGFLPPLKNKGWKLCLHIHISEANKTQGMEVITNLYWPGPYWSTPTWVKTYHCPNMHSIWKMLFFFYAMQCAGQHAPPQGSVCIIAVIRLFQCWALEWSHLPKGNGTG